MKIAQIAPLQESVPPEFYGGTERIVSFLTEELVKRGHDVTLYASGDSQTNAKLVSVADRALRLNPWCKDFQAIYVLQLEQIYQDMDAYDIVHFHTDYLHFPLSRRLLPNHVTTLHNRLDSPEIAMIFNEYKEIPVVSISDSQRLPLPTANWQATVYNGIDETPYKFNPEPGRYLAFMGRISPDKGIEEAIEIALQSDMELQIAAKIGKEEQAYFQEKIEPFFSHPLIKYLGEISESEKSDFLGKATATLFPVQWPEPFGMVMIESLACGTPVIAFKQGAVPEVLHNRTTGFIVNSINEAVESVRHLELISRYLCREVFEKRFKAAKMTDNYIDVYHKLLSESFNPYMTTMYPNSREQTWKKSYK
jgi:glycosyltransferase involved in cell wall biosynthesis